MVNNPKRCTRSPKYCEKLVYGGRGEGRGKTTFSLNSPTIVKLKQINGGRKLRSKVNTLKIHHYNLTTWVYFLVRSLNLGTSSLNLVFYSLPRVMVNVEGQHLKMLFLVSDASLGNAKIHNINYYNRKV